MFFDIFKKIYKNLKAISVAFCLFPTNFINKIQILTLLSVREFPWKLAPKFLKIIEIIFFLVIKTKFDNLKKTPLPQKWRKATRISQTSPTGNVPSESPRINGTMRDTTH